MSKEVLNTVRSLWRDERGMTGAAQLLLLITVVGIGAIGGLVSVRNQIVQEFGDIAIALENIDQSYSVTLLNADGTVNKTLIFADSDSIVDPEGEPPAGISLEGAAEKETSP